MANFLNEGTPTHRIPPEILTRILYLVVDRGFEGRAKQIILLTHVCRYWRTLLLSYPKMWSTLYMKPGNLTIISVWLARSQNVPLTVIAEFEDEYDHPPCRYQDSVTTILACDIPMICHRHKAVLSLNRLLPHRSRIRDLDVSLHLSDPEWDGDTHQDDDEPILLSHCFFRETLPNLQRLNFRAVHVEQNRYMIPVPDSLFAEDLPCLKELKYLGVTGGLTGTVKNLTSCEIGDWEGSAGPNIISPENLQKFFNNNKTIKSLTLNNCGFSACNHQKPTAIPMRDLRFLSIYQPSSGELEPLLDLISLPQFKSLHTVKLSSPHFYTIQVSATDGSGHTFEFSQSIMEDLDVYPLWRLGAEITTLRLDRGITPEELDGRLALYNFFQSLDAVQVLEFYGMAPVSNVLPSILSRAGVFPGLNVIRVAVSQDDCKGVLQLLAAGLRLRMGEGKPLTTVEPLLVGVEDGLAQGIRAEWEKHYEAEGIQNTLSG